jgi:DNA-binding CsgD family transcriptional regulator
MLDTITHLKEAPAVRLTPRDEEVLRLTITRMTDKQIGENMGISRSGVRRHKEKMLLRNDCESMSELIARYCAESGEETQKNG